MHYILTILDYINVDLLWKALGSLRLVRVRFYWIISGVPQMALLFWFGLVSKLKPRKVECYPEERQSLLPPAGARPLSAVSQEPGVSSACFSSGYVSILCLLTDFPEDTVGDFDTRTLPKFGSPGRGTESHVLSLQEVPPSGFGNWDKSIPAQAVPALTGCQIRLASSAVPNAGKSQSMLKRHKAKSRRKQRALTV